MAGHKRYYNQTGPMGENLTCEELTATMRFASNEDREKWIEDCKASRADDTQNTSNVEETGSEGTEVKTAGFGDNKLFLYVLIAGGLYYAYTKGMFKGLLK